VWDRADEGVARTVRALEAQLGPDQVFLVTP